MALPNANAAEPQSAPAKPARGPTASFLLLFSCGALLFLFCESTHPLTNDLAIFLAQGREMANEGGLADVDRFTHTVNGTSFLNGTWGAQRAFHFLWRIGGWGLLQLTLAISMSATVVITAAGARRVGVRAPVAAFAAVLAVWLFVQNLGLRPQLFALPLFAAYAAIAMTVRPSMATGIASAALVAVWANLHGSFAIAPALSLAIAAGVAWEAAEEEHGLRAMLRAGWASVIAGEARAHLLTAAAAIGAACANPYGTGIWRYVAENTSSPSSRGLYEWQRTSITDPCGIRLLVGVAAIGTVMAYTRRLPARRDVPAMLAFVGLALTAIRHVVWTGMVLPIGLARLVRPLPGGPPPEPERRVHPLLALVFAAFWGVLLVKQSPWVQVPPGVPDDEQVERRFSKETPARLAAWAAENGVSGNLFNSMEWGGYLVWRLPDARAFVDARIWIFPDDVWNEYLAISGARAGWEDALDRRGVRWAILEKRFHRDHLLEAMSASDRWEKRYEDEIGVVFRRREAPASAR